MAFLQGLIAKILQLFLDYFWGKITDYFKKREAQKAADKETEDRNKAARERLEQAETPEEREEAAGEIFRNNGN